MGIPTLPPPVDIDNDTKKAVIDGLKRVMAKFQEGGHLPAESTYQELISDPQTLAAFVETFLAHRDLVDDVVRPQKGDAPVRDDNLPLACGVSLNQIQQLLVRTCAKKVFEQDAPLQTITETVTKTSFLFFKKSQEVERTAVDPVEERKLREITRYVAFGWQLALLGAYRRLLNYQQIAELGDTLVALQSEADIAAVAEFDPPTLKKVRQATGADFTDILAHRPKAIGGIATWNKDMYEFYRKLLGEQAWTFFAREKSFFNVVAGLDKATAKVFGNVLCSIAGANLQEFQRLNIDKIEVLVVSLRAAFGDHLPQILGRSSFAKEILRKIVDNLLHLSQDKDKLIIAFTMSCKSMAPQVMEWMARQPAR